MHKIKSTYTLNTSADSLYFSRALNLIGSVIANSETVPNFVIWDIGLNFFERYLFRLNRIKVIKVPEFAHFWKDCYTWKLYVMKRSNEEIFLHLDAGNVMCCDINEIFSIIINQNYFFVNQGSVLRDIAPEEFIEEFGVLDKAGEAVFAAGNVGFIKSKLSFDMILEQAFSAALEGKCLGFSINEMFRDKKSLNIVRDCKLFRHDQTIFNLSVRKFLNSINILPFEIYASLLPGPGVKILNSRRRNYRYIKYVRFYFIVLVYLFAIDLFHIIFRRVYKHK